MLVLRATPHCILAPYAGRIAGRSAPLDSRRALACLARILLVYGESEWRPTMNTEAIRHELREGRSPRLRRRRRLGILSAIGAVDFAVISLYQLGAIRHLPDPPARIFDSDQVNASRTAYALGVPDGTLGLGLYALTLMLASAGGSEKSGRHPVFDVL